MGIHEMTPMLIMCDMPRCPHLVDFPGDVCRNHAPLMELVTIDNVPQRLIASDEYCLSVEDGEQVIVYMQVMPKAKRLP